MGVYTSGWGEAVFEPKLTAPEYGKWIEDCEADPDIEENCTFDSNSWGDALVIDANQQGFSLQADGKAYNIEKVLPMIINYLPAHVQVSGEAHFETENEPWALYFENRKVINIEVYTVDGTVDAIRKFLMGLDYDTLSEVLKNPKGLLARAGKRGS